MKYYSVKEADGTIKYNEKLVQHVDDIKILDSCPFLSVVE